MDAEKNLIFSEVQIGDCFGEDDIIRIEDEYGGRAERGDEKLNVAFIPVRGGSKSIPLKNIKLINGKPLVFWTIRAACHCRYIEKVYVSTDNDLIRKTVKELSECGDKDFLKIVIINRSMESASDTATTESAMLEFALKYDFENIILIQATSPLLTEDDLNRGFEIYAHDDTDSVLSAVKQKRFIWHEDDFGRAIPNNYDFMKRPRRQDIEGYYVENGAFYITSRDRLLKSQNRISGNIKICEMNESSYYEIDEIEEWIIVEKLLNEQEGKRKREKKPSAKPKIVLMDCDGVLTDGGMYYSEKGDEIKRFNTLDGMGIKLLRESGIKVGIITGENRELNIKRAEKLHLDYIEQGVSDKLAIIKRICMESNVDLSEVLYIGDDVNDLEAIKSVGIGCSVANGIDEVKLAATYVTAATGGNGAVREVADWILGGIIDV